MTAYVISLKPAIDLTDEQYYALCGNNPELRFERNAAGDLVIMPPVGGDSGGREADVITDLMIWNRQAQLGKVFSSSSGFKLPNGADRSPDAAWVRLDRWTALTPEQQRKFPPLCPDFVVEIRSATDSLMALQEKMQEYISNGAVLGLLINPKGTQVEVYRPGQSVVVLSQPSQVDCNPELPGFVLHLRGIL
jgi:Uma2 family endonuclease